MSLQNMQNEFIEMIFSGYQPPGLIKPHNNLLVYRNNISTTLIRALRDSYPMVEKLVGEDSFQAAALDYIFQYPSRSSNLQEYGEYFSHFLAEYPPAADLIYLPEVAEFEWTCRVLYFAPESPPFNTELLQDIPQEQFGDLHFILNPASRVIKFHYPILRIIDLCKDSSHEQINLAEGGVSLLIIRRELDIMLVTLTSAEYVFLNAIQDNHSLSIAVKAATKIDPQFNLQEKLVGWINDRTIVDLSRTN